MTRATKRVSGPPKLVNRIFTKSNMKRSCPVLTDVPTHMTKQEIFLTSDSFTSHLINQLMTSRIENGLDTYSRKLNILASKTQWNEYLENTLLQIISDDENSGLLLHSGVDPEGDGNSWIKYFIHNTSVEVTFVGNQDFVEDNSKVLAEKYEVAGSSIKWIYGSYGESVTLPIKNERLPLTEMYPFLGEENLEEYFDRFMQSKASILLLIGPPGTGKTSFIRGLLYHTGSNAIVSYDAAILEKDTIFASFIEGDASLFIMEDADIFLQDRKNGNGMMSKFLQVGDGLVSTSNKKLIFSTNLSSIKDIDPALIRPGRCHDILEFGSLTKEQALKLAKVSGIKEPEVKDGKKITLAEIFNNQYSPKVSNNKMGFIP